MNTSENLDLVVKHLAGGTNPVEEARLQQWLRESEANRKQYNQLQKFWQADKEPAFEPNLEKAWQKVSNRTVKKHNPTFTAAPKTETHEPAKGKVIPMYQWALRIAAVLTIIAGGFLIFKLNKDKITQPQLALTESVTSTDKTSVMLADGTNVWLNRNSKLSYPENFSGDVREVYLEGEAFFDVKRNPEKPFIIHAGQSVTKVLGTSFNVKAYANNPEVKVTVVTGKVSLAKEGEDANVFLVKGDQGVFVKKTGEVLKQQNDDLNFMAWQTGVLTFKKNSLEEIAQTLESYYQQPVTFENDAIKNCRFSAVLDNQPLTEVLEVLKLTLNLEYEQTDSTVILKGGGCQSEI